MTPSNEPNHGRLGWRGFFTSPSGFLFLIGCYFTLHVGVRLITSSTADLDEAEQLVATQQFAWGYGPQPPLYTWLQLPLVKLFGPTILPLALLKGVLLATLYAFTYWNARLVLRDHARAVVATVSLLLLPQISWEAQRDLTHSVLVTLFAVLTFHFFLRLLEKPDWLRYTGLGVVAGLGFLAKYSFGLFLAGLLLAGLTSRPWRRVVLDRRMLLAGIVCLTIVTPGALWAVENRDVVLLTTRNLMINKPNTSWATSVCRGLGSLTFAAGAHVVSLLAVYALVIRAWPAWSGTSADVRVRAGIIERGLLVIAGLLVTGILVSGASRFLDRWLMPVCVWLPILLAARLYDLLDAARRKILLRVAGLVALIITIAIPTRVWFAEKFNLPQNLNTVFEIPAAELQRANTPDLIIAETPWLAGNLRMQFPERRVICPLIPLPALRRPGEPCVLIWDLTRKAQPREQFAEFLRGLLVSDFAPDEHAEISASLKHFPGRQTRLGWVTAKLKPRPEK